MADKRKLITPAEIEEDYNEWDATHSADEKEFQQRKWCMCFRVAARLRLRGSSKRPAADRAIREINAYIESNGFTKPEQLPPSDIQPHELRRFSEFLIADCYQPGDEFSSR